MSEKVTVVTTPGAPPRVFKNRRDGADVLNRDDRPMRRDGLGQFIERRIDWLKTPDGDIHEVELE